VQGSDALSRAGVEHLLRDCREIAVAADGPVDLVLVVAETADEQALGQVRAVRAAGGRVVLVLQVLDDAGLLAVVEAGAAGVLRRAEATPASLERAVRLAAGGDGSLPPDLLVACSPRSGTSRARCSLPGSDLGGAVREGDRRAAADRRRPRHR
jgi:DNA-binding NarL/FixJ family response regulator